MNNFLNSVLTYENAFWVIVGWCLFQRWRFDAKLVREFKRAYLMALDHLERVHKSPLYKLTLQQEIDMLRAEVGEAIDRELERERERRPK